jgi:cytochrome c biogenesis protein CcdA
VNDDMECRGRLALPAALLFMALAVLAQAQPSSRLVFSPAEWDFGRIPDTQSVELEITVRNEAAAAVRVSFVPTCDCLQAYPEQAEIAPGGEEVFRLLFDPAGYKGAIDKDFIVRSTLEGLEKSLFRVYGEVRAVPATGAGRAAPPAAPAQRAVVRLSYYYSPGCRSCERFLSQEVPALEAELGVSLEVLRRNIFDPGAYERYLRLLRRLGQQERAYPAIVAGDRVLQGDREIEAGLRKVVLALAAEARAGVGTEARDSTAEGVGGQAKPMDLALLPVIAAGLLDGINPCAFTTLIFLVSALALAGRSRTEVLVMGLFYTASVFVTYFLIGLGFLRAVRYAQSFVLLANIIRWALAAVLAAFAALSFYDYLLIRQGKTGKVLLQLPSTLKKQIHVSIRARSRSATLVGSALVLGFLVSVFELACTGQVYLPTVVYIVRTGRQLRGYGYLILYNLGFIAPLLVVFGLSFAGMGLKGLTAFFQKSVAAVKLALAGLFAALAVVTILI